jgi:hypothetical protein
MTYEDVFPSLAFMSTVLLSLFHSLSVAIFFLLGQASRRAETSRDVRARESALQLRQAGFHFPIYLHGNFPSWILKFSELDSEIFRAGF